MDFRKIFYVLTAWFLVLLPFLASAQLVPCGRGALSMCNLCDLAVLITNIMNFLLWAIVLPICVIALITAGVMMMTGSSSGDEGKINQGKAVFKYGVFGLIIAFGSWLIVNTIMDALFNSGELGDWYRFDGCSTGGR